MTYRALAAYEVSMEKKVRAHAIIFGRVQGVFYRMETLYAAERIGGISGWVRNKRDGSVEAVFEGNETHVASILEWCKKGPARARVDKMDITWEEFTGEFAGFEITY